MRHYQFLDQLKTFPFIDKIILFGSRARGDHSEKSDIDLAVACPKASELDWLKIMRHIENADTLLKIDCVRLDILPIDSELKKNILAEGVVIYEKDSDKIRKTKKST